MSIMEIYRSFSFDENVRNHHCDVAKNTILPHPSKGAGVKNKQHTQNIIYFETQQLFFACVDIYYIYIYIFIASSSSLLLGVCDRDE